MKSFLGSLSLCAVFLAFSYGQGPQSASIAANVTPGIITRHDIHHDVSPPLRDLAKNAPALKPEPHEAEQVKVIPLSSGFKPADEPDPVLQKPMMVGELAPALGPTMGLNFEGLGSGFPNYSVNVAPPDTNGAVGLTQYVQWVNLSFAVFDKTTGNVILGPLGGNTLWAGFGGGCETEDDGDPIVTYDKLANRWVFSQLVVHGSGPFLQCVAVSTTSDATGSYNRYSFEYADLDDYPKMGVWPDAYYETFNMFSGGVFAGADACAYDRNAMLNALAAAEICFQQASTVGSLLPADFDGHFAPAAGTPNYMIDFDVNSLNLYKFHVDFNNPANSTFTGPVNIPVAPFTPFCPAVSGCVPQPGGDGTRLDSLGDRVMYRLAYRNFGDHESLVVNHSVVADPVAQNSGIRWYEIQDPNAAIPVVAQQSTFSPDTSYRWMGSIAMDVNGDIAVGYSVINSASAPPLFASADIAARAAADPLNTLQPEARIATGGGAQSGGLTRWGDYSAMQVDPADDCTFWYTTEYLQSTGAFNWNTRIANFKFPGCGIPDLSITEEHAGKFTEGQSGATYTITVTNIGGQPTDGTTVTATDILPAGLSATAISSTDATWACLLASLSCSRSDALAPGSSYPAITVTVNVAANAPGLVTNTATISGGGDKNPSNNTATDPTIIIVTGPDPTITKSHVPSFPRGQSGAYTITVTNVGLTATDPAQPLTVTDTLPAALTAVSASGPGWGTCNVGPTVTCTRSDSLPSTQSYPPITIVVSVASDAPPAVTNVASVAGGGDANPFNNSARDPTGIVDLPPGMAITNPVPSRVPSGATEFKPGTQIAIVGTATAPTFQDFRLQWAEGSNPATGWSSSGITLAGGGSTPVTNGPLGTWDTSGITTADYYTLRLLVDSAGFTNQVITTIYLEPSLLSVHWPVTLRVSPDLNSGFLPAVDASGKQRLVLVAPVYPLTQAIPGQYFSFAPDGSSQTVIDITPPSLCNPAVGTVEGTPGDDVVIADTVSGSNQGQMEFFRSDSTSFNFQLPSGFSDNNFAFNQSVLEDVEGKGQLDVVNTVDSFVHGLGVDPASIFAWRPDGSLLGSQFPIAVPAKSTDIELALRPRVFVADLQGNGTMEFIVEAGLSSTTFTLQLFAQDGTSIPWAVPVFSGKPLDLALADLDHNGKLETLLLMADAQSSDALHVFQPDGSERPGFPVTVGNSGGGHIAVGDLNRDGTEEIVVLPRNNNLMVLEPDGTPFPGNWSGLVPSGTFLSGPLALADIDGDGFPEILLTEYHLVGQSPSGPEAVPGQDGRATVQTVQGPDGLFSRSVTAATSSSQQTAPLYWTASLMAVRRDSTIVRTWNLPGADGNQPDSEARITVGDFDQDGITDIAVNNFIIDGGGTGGFLTGGIAMVLTTGAQFNAAANDWPMIHHDPHNTAVLRRDATLSVTGPAAGSTVSGTIQVTAAAAGPVGSIQFKLDGANLGPALVAAPFAISWDTTQVTNGPHNIVAMATDNKGQLIASAPVAVNVTATHKAPVNVSITLIAGTNPAKFGDTLSFAANLTPNAATGTVIIFDGPTTISAGLPVNAGSAMFTTSSLAVGMHSLVAQYSGDSNFNPSTSPTFIENVKVATNVSITLIAGTNPAKFGDTLSFAANVTPNAATGTVTIFDGTSAISGSLPVNAGSATFTTSSLAAGTHSLSAQYSGDSNFISSTSPAFTQNVMAFNVVASPQSASIAAGSSASFNFTVTPLGGFNQTVTFSCSGLPALAGCSFAPATVTPNGSTVTSALTITTTAPSAASRPLSGPQNGLPLYASLFGALGMAWLALGRRGRHSIRTARIWLGLAALCLAVVAATSCGGSAANPPPPRPGTPAGTNQIVVTASAANSSKTVTVTLVVQ